MNKKAKNVSIAGIIAALYIILTFLSSIFGLSSGVVQFRFSEALCILPLYTPAAVPGLFVGCALSNLIFGGNVIDIVFGSLATLVGAFGTLLLKKHKYPAIAVPILANTIILPFVQAIAYGIEAGYWYIAFCIFLGEFVSIGVFGSVLIGVFERHDLSRKLF